MSTATRRRQLEAALAHRRDLADPATAAAVLAAEDDLFHGDALHEALVDHAAERVLRDHPVLARRRPPAGNTPADDHAYEAAARRAGLRTTPGGDDTTDPLDAAWEAAAARHGLRA